LYRYRSELEANITEMFTFHFAGTLSNGVLCDG
jgi:hypothetical protein